jgi:outer membrane protein
MMRYLIYLLSVVLVSNISFAEKKQLKLEDCLKLAAENSKNISISKSKVDFAKLKGEEASTGYYPTLKLLGSYTRLSDVEPFTIKFPTSPTTSIERVLSPTIVNQYSARLSMFQPVFTGFRLDAGAEIASYNEMASIEDLKKEYASMTVDIKTAYWSYYKGKEQLKILEENIQQSKAHLADLESFQKNGLATLNDVLKLKVQISNLEYMKLDAETNINFAIVSLNTLLGLPLDTEIELLDKPKSMTLSIESLKNLVEIANENRYELKSMDLRYKASNSALKMSKAGWYPQISLAGNYTFAQPNPRLQPSQERFYGTWDVSVQLSYDLWNWNLTSIQSGQAEANMMQSKYALDQIYDGIKLEVTQNYYNIMKSKEKIEVAKIGIDQAEENLRVTNQRFKNGVSINSDLIDAETAWLSSKINFTSAVVDYEIAIAKLEKALGKDINK